MASFLIDGVCETLCACVDCEHGWFVSVFSNGLHTATNQDLSLLPDGEYTYTTLDWRRGMFSSVSDENVNIIALASLDGVRMKEASKKFVKILIAANKQMNVLVAENNELKNVLAETNKEKALLQAFYDHCNSYDEVTK